MTAVIYGAAGNRKVVSRSGGEPEQPSKKRKAARAAALHVTPANIRDASKAAGLVEWAQSPEAPVCRTRALAGRSKFSTLEIKSLMVMPNWPHRRRLRLE
jgi:hypothetical protein